MIRVGIIGGESIEAGELLRLLVFHPDVDIIFVHSSEFAGLPVTKVHKGLYGETDLHFTHHLPFEETSVLFACLPETGMHEFMDTHELPKHLKVVDFGRDFRLADKTSGFEYGLPELNRRATCHSRYVANPGAIPTCILLGLLPLAKHLMLNEEITAQLSVGNLYALPDDATWALDLAEIGAGLRRLQQSFSASIIPTMQVCGTPRALTAEIRLKSRVEIGELYRIYDAYYEEDSFTHISTQPLDVGEVLDTNRCMLHLKKDGETLIIYVYMDILLKGASGQAVHNMNLLFNLEESVGLRLKASVW